MKSRNKQHKYTEEQKAFLQNNVAGRSYLELTELFNKTFGLDFGVERIGGTIKRLGLKNGRDCRFSKEHAPFNKGKKGARMSPATEFKKGHVPINHRPVGSERISVSGYIEIKVEEPRKWRHKHNVVWEQHNGKIPKGCIIIFLDGDPLNCVIGNLAPISRRELLIVNRQGFIKADPELTKTGITTARLMAKIYEKSVSRR